MKLFGFEIRRTDNPAKEPSFVPKESDDGAMVVAPAGVFGTYVDMDGSVRSQAQLINKYRELAGHPEVDSAIEDIVNEAIVQDSNEPIVTLNLDDTKFSDKIKKNIREEFENVSKLYRFNLDAYRLFRQWYIDGRIYFHVVIDVDNPGAGIKDLRFIDPRKVRKIKELKRTEPNRGKSISAIEFEQEYYLFNPKGFSKVTGTMDVQGNSEGTRIAKDSIIEVTSDLLDKSHTIVVSYLQKAIKPLNNLRALEDSVVIYRISRAPERRIFYIDVGNLPRTKAEQYVQSLMEKFKNRIVYDSATGEVRDDRKFMTMLEDFWLPRREGGRGTEISTLPAGQNLGEMSDVEYFLRQLYKSLNVPAGRLESQSMFQLGRGTEISRDEDKFARFINRLRLKFSEVLLLALERQLVLKKIIRVDEWDDNFVNIKVRYAKDSYYSEVREAEIMKMRIETLQLLEPQTESFVGKYWSKKSIWNHILKLSENEIEDMRNEISVEAEEEKIAATQGKLEDLDLQKELFNRAQADGIVIDPQTGNIMPPQLLKPDPTILRDG